jgi:RNA polymerase-binding transcription factor DksA
MDETGSGDGLGVLDRAEAELEDVERALSRLDDGSYASCEACGRPISDDRLAISPLTRRCAEHDQSSTSSTQAGT